MDVTFVSEFADDQLVFRALEGGAGSFGWREGQSFPLDESYCKRVLDGRIPRGVPDAKREEATRDLRVTSEAGMGSYTAPWRWCSQTGDYTGRCAASATSPTRGSGSSTLGSWSGRRGGWWRTWSAAGDCRTGADRSLFTRVRGRGSSTHFARRGFCELRCLRLLRGFGPSRRLSGNPDSRRKIAYDAGHIRPRGMSISRYRRRDR